MIGWSSTKILTASVVLFTLLINFPVSVPAFSFRKRGTNRRSPVILVPGNGGSQLEAKLDKLSTVHYVCNRKTDGYYRLWLNLEVLFPGVLDCWVDNMRLIYDNKTRTTSNSPGVNIRVPGFGNTTCLEWLDTSQITSSAYFVYIVERLLSMGYQRGVDVKGAPYDYRKAPNEMGQYFKDIKNMTENLHAANSQNKVTFVCHSMGCPIMSYFFNQQSQSWKDKYVHALVSLGGAWGGAVKAMKVFTSGENVGVIVIKENTLRTEQRTSPSLAYMVPSAKLWRKDEVLVQTPAKNYTVANFYDFFVDIGFPIGYEMYKDTYNYASVGLNPPGVEIHCLHGINVLDTIERLSFQKGKFPDEPDLIHGNGDGTVNLRSLQACAQWKNKQSQKVYHLQLYNMEHMRILADSKTLDHIEKVVQL